MTESMPQGNEEIEKGIENGIAKAAEMLGISVEEFKARLRKDATQEDFDRFFEDLGKLLEKP